jgi:hypothetical protein
MKVVDSVGVTGVEPSGATLPTPGSMLTSVAFADVHVSVTVAPGLTVEGVAFSVTVGCTAGAGGFEAGGREAVFLPHPPTIPNIPITRTDKISAGFRELPFHIEQPP